MNEEAQIQGLEQRIKGIISGDADVFLVEIRIKPTNNIKVFVDGDKGVSIENLVRYNRRLYKQLEEENLYPDGNFSLEVSSPGLEEPLKLHRQYMKNKGRSVEIIDNEGNIIEGTLLEVGETELVVEEIKARLTGKNKSIEGGQGKGKKMETVKHTLLFSDIKSTRIQIKF